MRDGTSTGLAQWLAAPDRQDSLSGLAGQWRDRDLTLVLASVAPAEAGFGAHLRRSFLGALAPGASALARAGQPCPWDPPCALDVFLREQLRSGGDGLSKPYILFWQQQGPVMAVTLRVFGTACDWFPAVAEGLVAALSGILPWGKAVCGQTGTPQILDRQISVADWPDLPEAPLTLRLLTPMDDEGTRPGDSRDVAARLLSRALRRVDAMARWQGLALEEAATRALTAALYQVAAPATRLARQDHPSPNRQSQKRLSKVLTGEIDLPPLSDDLRLLLALAARCHIGRHTNEGLGMIEITPMRPQTLVY